MRILYVITDLEVGGVPLHLLRLARHVRGLGCAAAVVSLKPAGPLARRLQAADIEVCSCELTSAGDWRVFERLAAIIRDVAPDLVHSFLFHANTAARVACLLGGFPASRLLCEIQTAEVERTWHLPLDRLTHRLCRLTIGNSPSVIEHLHTRAGIPKDRLYLVLGGIDTEVFRSAPSLARASLSVADDEALLLWVGRLDPVKGLDTLLEAVDVLRAEVPIRLLLAGEGRDRASVEQGVARRGLTDCVTLLGRRDDVPRLLRTADVFVFPSRTEGLPNALLEAMAASLPVVATDVPGCRDLVIDGQTGLLVPPDDAGALAGAVAGLVRDKPLAWALGANACHFVTERFSVGRCHARYVDLYAQVLGKTGPV